MFNSLIGLKKQDKESSFNSLGGQNKNTRTLKSGQIILRVNFTYKSQSSPGKVIYLLKLK
jgi:hypothetical protein